MEQSQNLKPKQKSFYDPAKGEVNTTSFKITSTCCLTYNRVHLIVEAKTEGGYLDHLDHVS